MASKKIEIGVATLVAVSVFLIVIDYIYELSGEQKNFIYGFDLAIVAILIGDFYRRLRASGEGYIQFILKHWYEIPAMIPVIVFAQLETHTVIGGAIRSIRLVHLFRIVHLFFRTAIIFKESKIVYLIAFSGGTIIIGAFAEFIVESPHPDSKITNLGDALWWAIVTVTTVGYGDVYPVTIEGKIIASVLMIIGIGVLGIFISTFGAALVESRLRKKEEKEKEEGSPAAREDKSSTPQLEEEGRRHSDNTTAIISTGHSTTMNFNAETKNFIKQKIDEIEKMNEQEINTLMAMIRSIHRSSMDVNSSRDDG